jgi:proteasome lid subunit RPN8/RPN11
VTLWLRPSLAEQLVAHAQAVTPDEACGILVGMPGEIAEIIPAGNVAANPQTTFEIDSVILARTLTGLERHRQTLIGFYHSHPAGHPIPSQHDIRDAHYPQAVMLIVGLAGRQPEIAAWQVDAGQVSRVTLLIQEARPSEMSATESLSRAGRGAVLVAGLLALLLVLVVAFSLLPAPELQR